MRQPLHAQDLAGACIAALGSPAAANRAYNMSGAETLAYRDMVGRIFCALGRPVRLLPVPLFVFRFAVAILRLLPRSRNWSSAMAERISRDFGFESRAFVLSSVEVLARLELR